MSLRRLLNALTERSSNAKSVHPHGVWLEHPPSARPMRYGMKILSNGNGCTPTAPRTSCVYWDISGTTYRGKIVLYSILVQRSRFWGYFLSFFSNIDDKWVKNKKRLKKAIAFFSGGPHCSEMAYHKISIFGE